MCKHSLINLYKHNLKKKILPPPQKNAKTTLFISTTLSLQTIFPLSKDNGRECPSPVFDGLFSTAFRNILRHNFSNKIMLS